MLLIYGRALDRLHVRLNMTHW